MDEKETSTQSRIRRLKLDLASTIVVLAVTVTVAFLAAFSMAWFVSNRQVDAGGSSVSINNDLFELAVEANLTAPVPYDQVLAEKSYSNTETETSSAHVGVACALASDSNEPLRPGSTGTMTFYILPKQEGLDRFSLTLTLSGIKRTLDENDAETYAAVTAESALDLLKGHILFFEEKDANGKYAGWIDEGGFTYALSEHAADKVGDAEKYEVTLYWVWPRTYGQITLQDGSSNLIGSSLFTDASPDRARLEERISAYPEEFLDGVASVSSASFVELSDGYNRADQAIGEAVSYLVAELAANVVNEN
jgi:hypothetical protein